MKKSWIKITSLFVLVALFVFFAQLQSTPNTQSSGGVDGVADETYTPQADNVDTISKSAEVCSSCEEKEVSRSDSELDIQTSTDLPKWAVSGATGPTFSGDVVRHFPKDKLKFSSFSPERVTRPDNKTEPWCELWAVVTTIFNVSEAVRRQAKLRNWCLVVVFDMQSPETYKTGWIAGERDNAVVYLRPEEQTNLHTVKSFVDNLPWNHFGRKNIGYLYAIMHGANVIWDFDDDNALKESPRGVPSIDETIPANKDQSIEVLEPKDHMWPTYNPYPALGAPTLPSWPRGLPLDDVKVPNCSNTPLQTITLKASSIGVLQSLADYHPDVDAVFRLTMPIPFFFNQPKENKHLMIPWGRFAPYNAQATLHFKQGFFGLFLPITVSGRVSDIWRSYVAQRLFWDVGLHLGFIANPQVVQERNMHSTIGDSVSEWDLYIKSKQMIDYLGDWKGKGRALVERMEEVWVALYERQYIELDDVEVVQLWLQSLLDIGYPFPDLIDGA